MRVAGHNVIAIAAASAAFWVLGALWFGVLFAEPWMAGAGLTEADFEGDSYAWMALGVVISILTVIGLSVALRWGGLPPLADALKRAAWLWLGFGLSYAMYQLVYWPQHSVLLLAVMGSYTLAGWLIAAAILAVMR
jgi:hypothetical protein